MTSTDDSAVPSYPDRLRLDGRNLVVIGAGQGIGRPAAHAPSQVGANVFRVDIDAERVEEIAGEVGGPCERRGSGHGVDAAHVRAPQPEGQGRDRGGSPLKKVAVPADIASALLFLSSDLAGYVNGHTIVCDGGVSAKLQYPMPDQA